MMLPPTERFVPSEVRRWADRFMSPGSVFELRVLVRPGRTVRGYFDDPETLLRSAAEWSGRHAVYVTLNPVNPALLARSTNRLTDYAKATTADHDVPRRRSLYVDFDPDRPAEISSTDAEHDAALARARAAARWAVESGWPEPVIIDSGNGADLRFPIDLPNDDETRRLIERVIQAFDFRFSDEVVKVDLKVFNAARICRLPGTLNVKGDNVPDRPHRIARILAGPESSAALHPVLVEQLTAVAALVPEQPRTQRHTGATTFDLDSFIATVISDTRGPLSWRDGRKWIFDESPMCDHHDGAAFIVQFGSGAIAAGCHHDSCSWAWRDLRARFEPAGEPDRGKTQSSATHPRAADPLDEAEHDLTLMPSPRQPMLVAAKVIDDHHMDPALVPTLRWWRGSFYGWSSGRWAEVEDPTVRAELYHLLRDASYMDIESTNPKIRPWAPNRYKVADLSAALAAIIHTPQDTATPSWIARRDDDPAARELVSVGNGLLHISTRELREHTPRLFNTVAVPFPYDPNAATPKRWLAFLSDLWPDDPDARAALQQWFGYVISGDTRMHKILFMLGPFRSGKGTIGRVLKALVGDANTCGPTLASLSTNFGLQPLVGKSLAIVADARLGTANANVVVERLLSISGEDSLTIDRKYKDHWFGKLDSRFMIFSNELPAFGDASGAIATRFVILTLTRSWLGHENHQLAGELLAELPGILNWSLDGLDRLRSQDRFTEPASARDAIVTLLDTVSPTSAFVRDNCVRGAEHEVDVDVLYKAWRSWSDEQGRERPGSATTFGKNLRAVVPGVKRVRPRDDGSRQYRYAGIRLRTATDPQRPGPRTNPDQAGDEQADPGLVLAGPGTRPLLSTLRDPMAPSEPDDAGWIEL
ncbi:MAG TPA: hypothetical protein DCP25_14210 [Chloroflexi bacterium]|nr:hypothetical protein [Chloroflexota bacterium]